MLKTVSCDWLINSLPLKPISVSKQIRRTVVTNRKPYVSQNIDKLDLCSALSLHTHRKVSFPEMSEGANV